jgi:hypothetical protein
MTKEAINKIELLLEIFDVQKYRRRVDRLADANWDKSKKVDKEFRKKLPKFARGTVKNFQTTRREFKDTILRKTAEIRAEDRYNKSKGQ